MTVTITGALSAVATGGNVTTYSGQLTNVADELTINANGVIDIPCRVTGRVNFNGGSSGVSDTSGQTKHAMVVATKQQSTYQYDEQYAAVNFAGSSKSIIRNTSFRLSSTLGRGLSTLFGAYTNLGLNEFYNVDIVCEGNHQNCYIAADIIDGMFFRGVYCLAFTRVPSVAKNITIVDGDFGITAADVAVEVQTVSTNVASQRGLVLTLRDSQVTGRLNFRRANADGSTETSACGFAFKRTIVHAMSGSTANLRAATFDKNKASLNAQALTSGAGTSFVVAWGSVTVGSSGKAFVDDPAATNNYFTYATLAANPNWYATNLLPISTVVYGYAQAPSVSAVGAIDFSQAAVTSPLVLSAVVLADASVTRTQSAAAALTSIATLDDLYDVAKNWFCNDVNCAALGYGVQPATASGASLRLGALNLVIDANASAAFALSGTTITIKAASLATGSKFTSLATIGSVNFANGATITALYTSSAGASAQLQLTGLPSSSTVYVSDGAGASQSLQTGVSSSFTLNIPPGASGTWTWKVTAYGLLSDSGTFTPGTGGAIAAAAGLQTDLGITQSNVATVAAYTVLNHLDRQYDYLAYYETTAAGVVTARLGNKSGSTVDYGSRPLVFDASATNVFAYSGGTVTFKAAAVVAGTTFVEFKTTGAVTFANGATNTAIYTDSAGRHVLFKAAGLVDGTRARLFNVTDGVEVSNSVVAGGAGLTLPLLYSADKTFTISATQADAGSAKLPLKASGVFGSQGLSLIVAQVADTVYAANAIDGSTVTEFSADYPNIQVDINDPDGLTSVKRLYNWSVYASTTASGIASLFGAITAADSANYVINNDVVNLQLDNVSSMPVVISGGALTRSNGSTVIAPASGSIQMDPGRAYIAPISAIVIPNGSRVVTTQGGKFLARA